MANVPSPDRFVLEAGLIRANTTLEQAARRLTTRDRLDFAGLPGGALALLLTQAARDEGRRSGREQGSDAAPPMLVITPDQDSAIACAQDLRFFGAASAAGEAGLRAAPPAPTSSGQCEQARAVARAAEPAEVRVASDALPVLRFPAPDTSPFLPVAGDRKASMERVAALCHLAHGLPWQFWWRPSAR